MHGTADKKKKQWMKMEFSSSSNAHEQNHEQNNEWTHE